MFENIFGTLGTLLGWRDGVEIAVLWAASYAWLRWLAADNRAGLALTFLGYSLSIWLAHCIGLTTISTIGIIAAPVVCTIFIMVHAQTLQKNYITLQAWHQEPGAHGPWLEELMRGALFAASRGHECICLIERSASIAPFVKGTHINAVLSAQFLESIVNGLPEDAPLVFWIGNNGRLIAHDAHIVVVPDETWVAPDVLRTEEWLKRSLFITSKSDAIILHVQNTTRTCDIVIDSTLIGQITAAHAHGILSRACLQQTGGDAAHVRHSSHNQRAHQPPVADR